METPKVISGNTGQEIWEQIGIDLSDGDILEYYAQINQGSHTVLLNIDIDPGGGFEGGYATTQFSALIKVPAGFRFAVHDESFIDEIGKFFGMEDVITGYEELDSKLIVKTNDRAKVHQLFASEDVRDLFIHLEDFDLGLHTHKPDGSDAEQTYLELNIDDGITDAASLKRIYLAFLAVLMELK